MTRYAQGYRFELRVKADMESRGWWVIRAAGSHGPADLVCLKRGEPPTFIQCKADSHGHKAERDRLAALAHWLGVDALLALRVGHKVVYEPADKSKLLALVESGEAKRMIQAALGERAG